jgi:diketogulonate reductase-like aldo/keto reductase
MGTLMESWAPFTEGRRQIFKEPVLNAIADAHQKTAGQIALRYLVQNGIIVIPKTSKEERMKENISLFDFELSEEEMKQIARLNENRSLFGWYD